MLILLISSDQSLWLIKMEFGSALTWRWWMVKCAYVWRMQSLMSGSCLLKTLGRMWWISPTTHPCTGYPASCLKTPRKSHATIPWAYFLVRTNSFSLFNIFLLQTAVLLSLLLTASIAFTRWKVRGHGEVSFKICGRVPCYDGLRVQAEEGARLHIPHRSLCWSRVYHTASARAGTHRALHTLQSKQSPKRWFYCRWGSATWQVCSTQNYYFRFMTHVKTFSVHLLYNDGVYFWTFCLR